MKNLKKILLSLMVLFLAFAFIGCPAEPDPVKPPETPVTPEPETPEPETPVVTNNFKGNVFVAEYSLGAYSGYWGYIEFLDDTNGKMGIPDYDEAGDPIIIEQSFTYSVTDDVATLKATMDGMEFTVTTSKLTDGIFTFSTEDVDKETGETYSVLMTCTKGDKSLFDVWTVVDGEETLDKDFFYEFEYYVEVLVEKDDYNLDTTNKKIVLTANGHKKCCEPWTIVADGEDNENENYIESMLMFNMIGLNEPTDYTIDIDELTITVTPSGMGKIEAAMWTVLDPDGNTVTTFLPLEEAELEYILLNYYERFGLENVDYIRDDAEKTITLTASGWTKVQAAMGGGSGGEDSGEVTDETWTVLGPDGSFIRTFANLTEAQAFAGENGLEPDVDFNMDPDAQTITLTAAGAEKLGMGGDTEGGDSGEVYFYMYNGEPIGGKNTLEDFQYDDVKMYDLVEGTDYNIDHKNKYINFTDSGVEKLGMGGGSDDETWTVLDPEGNTLETFESLEAAGAFASSSGLVEVVDYDIDFDNQTITLTAEGLAKVSAGA